MGVVYTPRVVGEHSQNTRALELLLTKLFQDRMDEFSGNKESENAEKKKVRGGVDCNLRGKEMLLAQSPSHPYKEFPRQWYKRPGFLSPERSQSSSVGSRGTVLENNGLRSQQRKKE